MTLEEAERQINEIINKFDTGFTSLTRDRKEGEIRYIILTMKFKIEKGNKE